MKSNYHTHTYYSDGKNSVEDMVKKAIGLGFTSIGFSDHSHTPIALYGIKPERFKAYIDDVISAKKKYIGIINVYCGLELDNTSVIPDTKLDYTIGSVHFVKKNNEYIEVDRSPLCTMDGVNRLYGGDYYAYAKDYFEALAEHNVKNKCNIVGHFDLISKFNENKIMYDDDCQEYRNAWQGALYGLLQDKNRVFEVNTGAISRGYRTLPYPTYEMLQFIKSHNGTVVITTDCHCTDHIAYGAEIAQELITSVGVKCIDFEELLV